MACSPREPKVTPGPWGFLTVWGIVSGHFRFVSENSSCWLWGSVRLFSEISENRVHSHLWHPWRGSSLGFRLDWASLHLFWIADFLGLGCRPKESLFLSCFVRSRVSYVSFARKVISVRWPEVLSHLLTCCAPVPARGAHFGDLGMKRFIRQRRHFKGVTTEVSASFLNGYKF